MQVVRAAIPPAQTANSPMTPKATVHLFATDTLVADYANLKEAYAQLESAEAKAALLQVFNLTEELFLSSSIQLEM